MILLCFFRGRKAYSSDDDTGRRRRRRWGKNWSFDLVVFFSMNYRQNLGNLYKYPRSLLHLPCYCCICDFLKKKKKTWLLVRTTPTNIKWSAYFKVSFSNRALAPNLLIGNPISYDCNSKWSFVIGCEVLFFHSQMSSSSPRTPFRRVRKWSWLILQ